MKSLNVNGRLGFEDGSRLRLDGRLLVVASDESCLINARGSDERSSELSGRDLPDRPTFLELYCSVSRLLEKLVPPSFFAPC